MTDRDDVDEICCDECGVELTRGESRCPDCQRWVVCPDCEHVLGTPLSEDEDGDEGDEDDFEDHGLVVEAPLSGLRWHLISSTDDSCTYAMKIGTMGLLIRTVTAPVFSSSDGTTRQDPQVTQSWLHGVKMEDLGEIPTILDGFKT